MAPVGQDEIEKFRIFIEIEVIKVLRDISLKEGFDTKIQELAQTTLSTIKPLMSLDELYQSAITLDDKHPEFTPVVVNVMKEYENRYKRSAADQISPLVQAGKINEAENMVKKVLEFKRLN